MSPQATTHERQSDRDILEMEPREWIGSESSRGYEREPGAEGDTRRRLCAMDQDQARTTMLVRDFPAQTTYQQRDEDSAISRSKLPPLEGLDRLLERAPLLGLLRRREKILVRVDREIHRLIVVLRTGQARCVIGEVRLRQLVERKS